MKLYFLFFLILFSQANKLCAQEDYSGIMPYSVNPNYWQYKGEAVLLIGGSDSDNIFQWAGEGTKLTDHLDLLKSCGGNYIRCALSSRAYTPEGYRWDILPHPYAKIDGKYDLSTWNEEYWDKFRTFLNETWKREIIVQLEVWDRWNESGNSEKRIANQAGWYDSPYNPNNNINYSWDDTPLLKKGNTKFYNDFHLAAVFNDTVLLKIQNDFINKVIDEIIDNGFDHVLFQIDNESGIGDESTEPDPYWARYIRDYAGTKSKNHPVYVCSSRRFHKPSVYITDNFRDWKNPDIYVPILNPAFNFCDISQNNGNSGQEHYDNLIWYREKVHENYVRPINHIKCYHFNWPTGSDFSTMRTPASDREAASKFWRAVFAGSASIRFHRNTAFRPGGLREGFGLTPEGQTQIKSADLLLKDIDIFKMEPCNGLLKKRSDNEAYCMAEPGKQYAVFFTGDGDGSVEIRLEKGRRSYELKWLDINNCTWKNSVIKRGGNKKLIMPDKDSQWIAVLINKNNL